MDEAWQLLVLTELSESSKWKTLQVKASSTYSFMRINAPIGGHPVGVAFSDDSSIIFASQTLSGSSLYMYEEGKPKNDNDEKNPRRIPAIEMKWEHHKIHDHRAVLTLVGTKPTYGSSDGGSVIVSCSEGTDIILWHGRTGKKLGLADTNQLKNTMAAISPNGRFIAASAFTADVKVWEILYGKDGCARDVVKVMQLKGHKSAVTWLCFMPTSEGIVTSSKDGSMRIWNINVRYRLDEDPRVVSVFTIPVHFDRMELSPDGRTLAATRGSTLQWLCVETGEVLDTCEKAHDGSDITCIAWTPVAIPIGGMKAVVLATAGSDKKVKLWMTPMTSPASH